MAANSPIGSVTKFLVKTITPLGETQETTLNTNLEANTEATYEQVDTAVRALMALSGNTYDDTICVTNISTNAEVSG